VVGDDDAYHFAFVCTCSRSAALNFFAAPAAFPGKLASAGQLGYRCPLFVIPRVGSLALLFTCTRMGARIFYVCK
jgi:hypothetical protein